MWFSLNYLNVGTGLVVVGMSAGNLLGAHTEAKADGWSYLGMPQLLQKQTLGQSKPVAELCQCFTRK